MAPAPRTPADPAEPRATSGALWEALCETLRRSGRLVYDDAAVPRDRAEGLRYLTRFLAAGIAVCVEHADPDHPEFCRMIDRHLPWGLDCPDCLYLYASVREGARYRIHGRRGSANHLDIQVNAGHFATGDIGAWRTIDSTNGLELDVAGDGRFELLLGGPAGPPDRLALAPDAEFVLVRQYFDDWEREEPADLVIERLDARGPVPPPRTDQIAARFDRLCEWLEKGGALWDQMSRGMLSLPPNSLVFHRSAESDQHAGMQGQSYGIGNFACTPDEAVVISFEPPDCRHWNVSLANRYWEAIEYGSRQSSLNRHQARLDADGRFRGVIAHSDPGVPNWLDPAGHERGTLAVRFLLPRGGSEPGLERLPLADLRDALPSDTPRVGPEQRAAALVRRRRSLLRRLRR